MKCDFSEVFWRLKRKYFIEFLRNSQFLSDCEEIVDFSFRFFVVLRFDLIEEDEIAIEHLKAVHKLIRKIFIYLNRVDWVDYYLVRLHVGGNSEFIELKLDITDEEEVISMMDEAWFIFFDVYVCRVHYVTVLCCQNLEFEVHDESVLGVVVYLEFLYESIGNIVDSHQRFKVLARRNRSQVEFQPPESVNLCSWWSFLEEYVEDILNGFGDLH